MRCNAANAAGDTPLHALAGLFPGSSDNLVIARLLLEKGAPRDARDAAGRTPAELAAAKGAAELAALIAP